MGKSNCPQDRQLDYLFSTVKSIYEVIKKTEQNVEAKYPQLKAVLPEQITFISSEDLLQKYPTLTPKERENAICKEFGAVFIYGIGGELSNGELHDARAADYDDWSTENSAGFRGLNGDILVWNPVLESAFELSSMGIRVDKEALTKQLEIRDFSDRKNLLFHSMLLDDKLTESIGGGIGQSRMCMFMLKSRHIGEVQASIWDGKVKEKLKEESIELL